MKHTARYPLHATILICYLATAMAAQAQTVLYVDDDAAPGGDGTTWATAYNDLQDALAAASASGGAVTEVRVGQGTYTPAGPNGDREATFELLNGVALKGGYAGLGAPDPDDRDPDLYDTILSGDLNGDDGPNFVNNDENSYHVVTGSGTEPTAILDGCTITAGNAYGLYWANGGGVFVFQGSPTLSNCVMRANTAERGSGLYSTGNVTLDRCVFRDNVAMMGGGVYNNEITATLTHCTFVGNTASEGGAIFNDQAGPPEVLTMMNCCFFGNAANFGGAIYSNRGPTVFVNCLFSGNFAARWGGAIFGDGPSGDTITNCTFSQNVAGQSGGAIVEFDYIRGLTNCILWGNRAGGEGGESAQILAEIMEINYCCVEGWTGDLGGVGNIGDDPLWIDPDGPDNISGTEDDNVRLRAGSPCTDAGSNDADTDLRTPGVQPLPAFDLDDNPRFTDDPDTPDTGQGTPPIVDIGAYEGPRQAFLVTPGTITVPEGGLATFTVALAADPLGTVSVSVAKAWGDPDIAVYDGGLLTFDSADFSVPQTVTVFALEDQDFTDGQAPIRVQAPDIPPGDCIAVESDDEPVPAIVFVDADAGGANIGTSWVDAFVELRDALSAAGNRSGVSEVRVASGTYRPEVPGGDRSASFTLVEGVDVYGGFAGGETCCEDRNAVANVTVLSGDLNGDDGPDMQNNGENSYHVVSAIGDWFGATMALDGFTIAAGNANGVVAPDAFGAGMYNFRSGPTLSRCVFLENSARRYGGGLYNAQNFSVTVAGCDFVGNHAGSKGGGVYNYAALQTIVANCRFADNHARDGAGMASEGGSGATLINCLFTGNAAQGAGGGLFVDDDGQVPSLINCTFGGNVALGTASQGRGAGIRNRSNLEIPLTSCILWGNLDFYGTSQTAQLLGPFAVNYCCVQGWTGGLGGVGNIGDDPLFVDADGSDDIPGTADDDLRLLPGSLCIDAGDNRAVPADDADLDGDGDTTERTPLDLDGNPRFVDDPDTGDTGVPDPPYYTEIVDMGAYEFFPDCNHNGIRDECDVDCGPPGGSCDLPGCGQSEDCNTNGIPDECEADADGDGVIDDCDACPDTHVGDPIVIDGCDTGVADLMPADDGCSMAQRIGQCGQEADNHGAFVSCVAHLSNGWKQDGLISGQDKGHIQCCAAQADIP